MGKAQLIETLKRWPEHEKIFGEIYDVSDEFPNYEFMLVFQNHCGSISFTEGVYWPESDGTWSAAGCKTPKEVVEWMVGEWEPWMALRHEP